MNAVEGICFDATGTLIEMTESVGDVYRRVALDFGVDLPAWRLEEAFARVLQAAPPRGCEGETQTERETHEVEWWSERIRQTFQATDSSVLFDDFVGFSNALFESYRAASLWRVRAGAEALLDSLARNGPPLALVSNFDHRLPDLLEALEIDAFFESLLIPSKFGERKPERACFERAARQLDCPLASLLYVGDDSLERMDEIHAHGLRTLCVSPGKPLTELEPAIRSFLTRSRGAAD